MTAPILRFPAHEPAPAPLIEAAIKICNIMADQANWTGELAPAIAAMEQVNRLSGAALSLMRSGAGGVA